MESEQRSQPEFVLVGRVVKPHGLEGEVLIRVMSDNPNRFDPGSELLLGPDPQAGRRVRVRESRRHLGRLLLTLDQAATLHEAELLRGELLFVAASDLQELEADAFWEHQLVGMTVRHQCGVTLGTVHEVLGRPGQDLWSIETPSGHVLFPAAGQLVISVDRDTGVIVIDPPEGLFESDG